MSECVRLHKKKSYSHWNWRNVRGRKFILFSKIREWLKSLQSPILLLSSSPSPTNPSSGQKWDMGWCAEQRLGGGRWSLSVPHTTSRHCRHHRRHRCQWRWWWVVAAVAVATALSHHLHASPLALMWRALPCSFLLLHMTWICCLCLHCDGGWGWPSLSSSSYNDVIIALAPPGAQTK